MSPTFLLAICALIQDASAPKVETLRGARFEVIAHFDARKLAEEALFVAEATAARAEPLFGRVEIERKGAVVTGARMPIHLYWNPAEFAAEFKARQPTSYATEFAFTSESTKTAYVLLTPMSVANALSVTGLPVHTKLAVARQAAELWARRASPLASRWPYWFFEGALSHVALETCVSKGIIQDASEDPATASSLLRSQHLLAANGLPNLFAFVDGFPGGLTNDERRSVAGLLFRFLADQSNAKVLENVAYAARMTKQDDVPEAISRVMRSVVGDAKAQGELEARFDEWLRSRKPAWEELHGSLWTVGDTWIQAADGANSVAWRADLPPTRRYEVAGEVAFFPAERRQANVLLARGEHTFLAAAFVADHGVDVLEFDARRPENERWKKLAEGPLDSMKEGRFIPFRVAANVRTLDVSIDGKPVLSLDISQATPGGGAGLGVFAGSCCAWRNLSFTALP